MKIKSIIGIMALILSHHALHAQRGATIPDPDPELERKTFILPAGFEVNLWAADPLLAKPIQMNWDAKGRLWIASSEVYPQIQPGQTANDKILILEDTDGDVKADKTEVFADGLLIPTGLLPGDGGCYVANSTEILHLSQSKPGIKADKKRVVLSGFGTEDTHHLIRTFRWGPDGAMYFNQSVYIHSHVETPHGVQRLNGGGVWRYEPRTQKLSVFLRGFWNPWGHAFDKYGNSFLTDGANGEGIVHGVPGASYPTGGNQAPRVLHGLNPGSPKFCGLDIVSGRHFPDDWQGDLITNDFRGHRVCRFKLRDDGSTFESREMEEVIKSNHPAFRPIDCLMGPDGALYIADWYNPIIQHGEVDFRDPRRDKTHGRIWRVTAKGRPLVEKPKLTAMKVPELLDQLNSPAAWTRQMAKNQLLERARDDVNVSYVELVKRIEQPGVINDSVLLDYLAMYSSWKLQGRPERLDALATSTDAGIRAAYARYLAPMGFNGDHLDPPGGINKVLKQLLNDPHPRVRLEAVRTAATYEQYTIGPIEYALSIFEYPMDATLNYALTLSVRELEPLWMPRFREGGLNFNNDMKKLAFALEAVQSPESIEPLVKLLKSGKIPKENLREAWTLVAKLGNPTQLLAALRFANGELKDEETRIAILAALENSARSRNAKPPMTELVDLFDAVPVFDSHRERLILYRLIGLWKLETERSHLKTYATLPPRKNPSPRTQNEMMETIEEIRAALDGLALMGGKDLVEFLEWLSEPIMAAEGVPPTESILLNRASASYALLTLIRVEPARAVPQAVKALTRGSDDVREIVTAFLQQKNGAAMLAKGLASSKLSADTAKIALKAVRSAANPSPASIVAISNAGNLEAVKKEPNPEEVKSFAADAVTKGDAARGETIYRRKELQCLACHAIGGAGGQVGPDLTSIGASAQPDYLVESLLLPNKAIKEGYHTLDLTTTAGKIVSGIKIREAGGELVLRDKDDKEITLRADDIDTRRNGRSLMPDGTTESLTRAELLDLLRFLGELGKVGPYEPSKARLVRKWEVVEPSNENLNRFRRERIALAAEKPASFAWSNAYSKVSGELPLADIPAFTVWKESGLQSVVRFKLLVSTAGDVALKANALDGVTAYVGAQPVPLDKPIAMKTGEHVVTLILDRGKRSTALAMELTDVPGSSARVSVVGGK